MSNITRINTCRSCGCDFLDRLLDLGTLAFTGRFPANRHEDVPSGPLELLICTNCGLVQLAHNFDPNDLYCESYGYRSGINSTMQNHLTGIVDDIEARLTLRPRDIVMDIGSNDGTLLSKYNHEEIQRVGIDPTIMQFESYYDPSIIRIADFFSEPICRKFGIGHAKVITSISMFYDLPNPNEFVADISECLHPSGIWVLEQSYVLRMLEQNAYDTICHEHLEYYGLRQISDIVSRQGLRVFDVEFNDCNGGSFRVFVCHQDAPFQVSPNVEGTLKRETQNNLHLAKPYLEFSNRVERLRDELVQFVNSIVKSRETLYVYGASTKGNTLLQYCGLDKTQIIAAADRNPNKWGSRTPGTDIPIISEAEARAAVPDYFLVLPWHFRDEFLKREEKYLKRGGKIIFPLPELTIVG